VSASKQQIQVSVPEQKMRIFEEGEKVAEYVVSTSKFGLGSEEGSFKTPTGKFRVKEKHGDDAEPNTIFKGRKPVGKWEGETVDEDLVLSRILWLDGEDDDNKNSFERYIYIHGTNQEELIGQPSSHGCVRMRNEDVIDLYAKVDIDTEVEILT